MVQTEERPSAATPPESVETVMAAVATLRPSLLPSPVASWEGEDPVRTRTITKRNARGRPKDLSAMMSLADSLYVREETVRPKAFH